MLKNKIEYKISSLYYKIVSLSLAISIALIGFVYKDTPIDVELNYDIPSGVYEYEPGDVIEIHATSENKGRPFVYEGSYAGLKVSVYKVAEGGEIINIDNSVGNSTDDATPYICKKGKKSEVNVKIVVSDEVPKGTYHVRVSQYGTANSPCVWLMDRDVITVK